MAIRIGDLLVQHGIITPDQLDEALHNQQIFGGRLGTNVVELGYVSEATLAKVLSEQLNLPSAEAHEFDRVSPDVVAKIKPETASKYKVVPLSIDGRQLRLAMSDPTDLRAADEIAFSTGLSVTPVVAPEMLIVYALEKHYGIPRDTRYVRMSGVGKAGPLQGSGSNFEVVSVAEFRGFGSRAVSTPTFTLAEASQRLAAAEDHDDIFEVLRRALAQDFEQSVVFVFRSRVLIAWAQAGCKIEDVDLRKLSIPLDRSTLFGGVCKTRTAFIGKPEPSETDRWMFRSIGLPIQHEVLCLPVVVNDQPVCLLLGVQAVGGSASKLLERYETLARKVGHGVQMLFYRKRILGDS